MENKRKSSSYNHGVVWYPRTNVMCTFVQVVNVLLLLGLLGGAAPWSVKGSPHCSNQTNSGAIRPHSLAFAEFGAVGDENSDDWPIVEPLPSYGRGRELTGGRHQSLIHGRNLTDIIITDSSDNLCIEDCHISTGDDLVSIKNGWDEYGTLYDRPSRNIILLRITGKTETSAGIAIGSEMSGDVSEVHAEDLHFFGSKTGIRIKTSPGKGGYVRNIYVSKFKHDLGWYRNSCKVHQSERITFKDIIGENIKTAGLLEGLEGENFLIICLSNITRSVTSKSPWKCSSIQGHSDSVSPETCTPLKQRISPEHYSVCYSLSDDMWIS